jgi:hypothetical protein
MHANAMQRSNVRNTYMIQVHQSTVISLACLVLSCPVLGFPSYHQSTTRVPPLAWPPCARIRDPMGWLAGSLLLFRGSSLGAILRRD